jgi:lantibiotic modifying enzyme
LLYRPEDFEPLTEDSWDAERVREAISAIVANSEAAFDPDELWPADERDLAYSEPPVKDLYTGAAGVAFALDALRRRGHADVGIDLAGATLRALKLWQHAPDYADYAAKPTTSDSSLLCGEAGILTVAYRLAPSDELADRLFARVRENVHNDANELAWGSPGTMLAAHAMHAWTGEQRWRDAWTESANELRRRRDADGLWTQRFGDREQRLLGAAHGAVGNQLALLQAAPPEDARDVGELLERAAIVEGPLANWPTGVEPDGSIRVQWCHGAPGIVISAASYLPEELILAGAELTWQAGGHGKGPGLCHGTAGNGYALLKAFEHTGDERWLDRARRFAMHALEQVERQDRPRHSLFTGDIGVALYAADCLDARARFPVLDGWD